MSQTTRPAASTSLQGVEKSRQAKPLGLRASNALVKGPLATKNIRPLITLGPKSRKEPAAFDVYVDENGGSELNVVKQLEKAEPVRVPFAVREGELLDEEPCSTSPSSRSFVSMGEDCSEYYSVPDVFAVAPQHGAYDTPAVMVEDMFEYMRLREQQFIVKLRWEKQPELNDSMRIVLLDWLHDVLVEYDMESETLHLAASLVDRLLMKVSVSRANVQLLGTAALMIAAKYEQIQPPLLTDFAYVTDDSFSESQILRMEQKILNYLHFDVSVPTVEWFISYYLNILKPPSRTIHMSHYLGDLSLMQTSLNGEMPSVIGAACLALANLLTGPAAWTIEMETRTSIVLKQLQAPMTIILNALNASPTSEQRSVHDKYCRIRYDEVALIQAPSVLPNIQ